MFAQGPSRVYKISRAFEIEHSPIDGKLVLWEASQSSEELPWTYCRAVVSWRPAENEDAVRLVAHSRVVCGEIDIPATIEGMKLRGPNVPRVLEVGGRTPYNIGSGLTETSQRIGCEKLYSTAIGSVGQIEPVVGVDNERIGSSADGRLGFHV